MRISPSTAYIMLAAFASCVSVGEEGLAVLPETIGGAPPGDMMEHYLLGQIDEARERWLFEYEARATPEAIAAYQTRLCDKFVEAIGGFPERTPLNPRVTGTIQRNGYRVEKVIFESQPKLFVTAALFVPESGQHQPPHPGVLVPCGHAENAKAYESYQSMGALLALNGMVALVFDPIEQGERMQLLDGNGKWLMWGTQAHTMVGVGSILLGRNTATFEIWDGMRGIDYLQSRPEVDAERIGCTGNSGGGTQTSYIMALDDRVKAAAPSCYLNYQARQLRTATGDAEQNIFGQLAFGMDHADFLMMRAPTPIMICAATDDFFDINATWETFRHAKRLYSRMGHSERIDLLENDAEHNYNKLQREGAARWLARWLLDRDEPLVEPAIELIAEEDLWCTPKGRVMLLEGARSTYDLNEDYENELAVHRAKVWAGTDHATLLGQVRRLAGIRELAALPKLTVDEGDTIQRDGYSIEKLTLRPEDGICLPALMLTPDAPGGLPPTLYLDEKRKARKQVEILVQQGRAVMAVDVRGTGETRQTGQGKWGDGIGRDWEDVYKAYVLGRSYVGMRAEDILVCARHLAGQTRGGIDLIACGEVGVPALHAAALEPGLFASVKLIGTLESWACVVHTRPTRNQLVNTVHGALEVYDLPDLAATLGDKLTLEEPADALGQTQSRSRRMKDEG